MKVLLSSLLIHFSFFCFAQYDLTPIQKINVITDKEKMETETKYGCKYIPLYQYKLGMKFFFPRIHDNSSDRIEYYTYKKVIIDKKNKISKSSITYNDVENKIFEIIKIQEEMDYSVNKTVFWLKDIESDLTIEHRVIYSLSELQKQDKESYGQLTELPDVIYTDEIDKFKNIYLNQTFYANFAIGGIKFQKVKIVQIGAGTAIYPIRAIVQNDAGEMETKDFNTCGTNVNRIISNRINFDYYFSIDNPKIKYKISEKIWNQIIESKIGIGFSTKELMLSWGEPKKINKTVTNNIISEQYVYNKQYVYLENDRIVSIQDNK